MRKSWLIAGAAIAATAGASQAAEVELFGIHTPSLGKWAVYARISDVNSTSGDGIEVVGMSSISINVLNNTVAGAGTSTVTASQVTLPSGVSKYVDMTAWPDASEGIGYGFWVKDLRRNGTIGATGAREISATQYAIYDRPLTTVPYNKLVLPGVGISAGSVTKNDTTGGDFKTSTSWAYPVQVASGSYTPAGATGAGANVGLKMEYIDLGGGSVNLLRPSFQFGNDYSIEAPVASKVVDARAYTLGAPAGTAGTTVKAGQGDANLDGTVNFNDLLLLAKNYGKESKTWFEGDFDYSGNVNFNDLLVLAKNYGKPVPSSPEFGAAFNAEIASAFAAVPEPGTLGLIGLGIPALCARRRRK
jgi:hypothetical protein